MVWIGGAGGPLAACLAQAWCHAGVCFHTRPVKAVPSSGLLLLLALALPVACLGAFARLNYALGAAVALTLAIFVGGRIELPLLRLRRNSAASIRLRLPDLRVGVNVGGCLVPLAVAIERGLRLSPDAFRPLAVATVLVAGLSFLLARPVADRGVVLAWPLTGLFGAALGLTLGRGSGSTAIFAYFAGLVGPLIGAELPYWPALVRLGAVRAAIGGGGAYDGLLWSGLLAALLGVAADPGPVSAG